MSLRSNLFKAYNFERRGAILKDWEENVAAALLAKIKDEVCDTTGMAAVTPPGQWGVYNTVTPTLPDEASVLMTKLPGFLTPVGDIVRRIAIAKGDADDALGDSLKEISKTVDVRGMVAYAAPTDLAPVVASSTGCVSGAAAAAMSEAELLVFAVDFLTQVADYTHGMGSRRLLGSSDGSRWARRTPPCRGR